MFNIALNYSFVLGDMSNYLLLCNIEKYVNGAILQIRRVEVERKSYYKKFSLIVVMPSFPKKRAKVFLDAHYYFICIGQVDKNFKRLAGQLKNKKLDELHYQFQNIFKNEIRNDLEHLDARAVGKTRFEKDVDQETKKSWILDFVNFYDDKLSFGGRKYPINNDSIKRISKIYLDIIKVIRKDYALRDENFMEMENSLKQLKSLKRWLPKFNKALFTHRRSLKVITTKGI